MNITLCRKPNLDLMKIHQNYENFFQQKTKDPGNYTINKNPFQNDTITVNNLSRGIPIMLIKSIKKDQEEGRMQYICKKPTEARFLQGRKLYCNKSKISEANISLCNEIQLRSRNKKLYCTRKYRQTLQYQKQMILRSNY